MYYTHRSAVDNCNTGMSTTYCGLELPITNELLSNDPTCLYCQKKLLIDRQASGSIRNDDPSWVKTEIMKTTNLSIATTEELMLELEKRKLQAEKDDIPQPKPIKSIDITNLVKTCVEYTNEIAASHSNLVDKNWIYETVIEAVYGKEYWTWFNKY